MASINIGFPNDWTNSLFSNEKKNRKQIKIVTWNCNGVFRKKYEYISELNADIYIIQECENPVESRHKKYREWAENKIWIGDTKNKGLAIFVRQEIELEKLDWSNQFKDHFLKHCLPSKINQDFDLLAVWTHLNN